MLFAYSEQGRNEFRCRFVHPRQGDIPASLEFLL